MSNVLINRIVAGATQDNRGYNGIIATTPSYTTDEERIVLNWICNEMYQYFITYNSDYTEKLQISFPILIQKKICNIVCCAKKRFTQFPQVDRYYDRLEYFYSIADSEFSSLDILNNLPEMQQYDTAKLGSLSPIEVSVTHPLPVPSELTKNIFEALFSGKPIAIKTSETKQKDLIDALSPIPLIYQKYLGFGFNIKRTSSYFLENKLHIYTTEDDGILLNDLKRINSANKEFVEAVFEGKVNYPDTELQLLETPLTNDALYKLLNYHNLHYIVDTVLSRKGKLKEELKDDLNKYVLELQPKKTDEYIRERLLQIKKLFYRYEWIDLFNRIEVDDEETINIQMDLIYNKSQLISPEQAFRLLNLKERVSDKKKDIIKHCGLPYLFDNIENYLKDKIIRTTIHDLLKDEPLETKLMWKCKYSNYFKKLSIKVTPNSDFQEFSKICDYFETYYLDEYKNIIKVFVQQSIDLDGDREFNFYRKAFEKAKKYNFTVTVKEPQEKGENLLETYKLFTENSGQIDNKKLLARLATCYIKECFPTEIDKILKFNQDNKEFIQQYNTQIDEKLVELCNNTKYNCLKAFLLELKKIKEIPFLQEGNKLYSSFKSIENLSKKECFELNKIKGQIKNIPQYLVLLVNGIIDNSIKNEVMRKEKIGKEKIGKENKKQKQKQAGNNEKNIKIENIIEYSTRKVKWVAAIFIGLFVCISGLFIWQFKESTLKKEQTAEAKNRISETNTVNIDSVVQYYKNELIKMQGLVDSFALQPYPNDNLNEKDVKALWMETATTDPLVIGLSIDSVVKIIFAKNQGDIRKYYKGKEDYYRKFLLKKNPNCFDANAVLQDSIKIVPCFKAN
jgi:hypothetical protein